MALDSLNGLTLNAKGHSSKMALLTISSLGDAEMKKIIALSIAIFIIAVLASTSFTQQKPERGKQPAITKQTIQITGDKITIIRDSFGVPHIFADTERGVYYGGGYAVAQDRLVQLERYRRDARGELAEIEGPEAYTRDLQVRTIGYTEAEIQGYFDGLTDD